MTKEIKSDDILDQVKQAEQEAKRRVLLKRISELKGYARDVLEAKKKCELLLEDCGVREEDAKRLLDYINSLSEVQLSEDDVANLREDIKAAGSRAKREVVEKMTASNVMMLSSLTGTTTSGAAGVWSPAGTSFTSAGNSGAYLATGSTDPKLLAILDEAAK